MSFEEIIDFLLAISLVNLLCFFVLAIYIYMTKNGLFKAYKRIESLEKDTFNRLKVVENIKKINDRKR